MDNKERKIYYLYDEDINILILSLYSLYTTDGIKDETKLKIKNIISYLTWKILQ